MMDGAWMGWMWFWPALVVAGLVLAAVGAVWWARSRRTNSAGGPDDARRILDERFARGEIDEAEYRRRRAELR